MKVGAASVDNNMFVRESKGSLQISMIGTIE